MNNAQLIANGISPVPVSLKGIIAARTSLQGTLGTLDEALRGETAHADNFDARGHLTARGIRIINQLFTTNLNDVQIAELMDITPAAVGRRRHARA